MKTLMMTTALVAATAFGAAAQTGAADMTGTTQGGVPAFVSSDFTGMTLYTLGRDSTGEMGDAQRDQTRWSSSDRFLEERDDWQSIGSIDDVVMTKDGEVRGVLVDVGGFLGFGARTVMVAFDDLYFVTEDADAETVDDFFVVIEMSQDQLENLPEWDEEQLRIGFESRSQSEAGAMPRDGDSAMATRGSSETFPEGYTMLEGEERTADRLMGADVHDANGETIGSVNDVVIGDDQRITDVIVDVGGFLGMGSHTVALPIEDARIGWHDEDGDARVQVSMTADQLENMPEYEG
ncbi:PRC-barrel domain-containing protein [Rhodobaculum claviforme]|nr:PRC-barrel domain-containing protein [Rhodobaculum claviforme]